MSKRKVLLAFLILGIVILIVGIGMKEKREYIRQKGGLLNPSRGFYVQIDSSEKERIEKYYKKGIRLVLLAVDIEAYADCPIPGKKLEELEGFFTELKRCHMKAIVRPAYGFEKQEENDADTFERIEEHAEQLAGVINDNTDCILGVQAGFFGPWGEWHSSKFLEDETEAVANRNRLLAKLLEEYDKSVIINVRRPRFIRDAKKAGLDCSRIGYHNDGLLSDESDYGTYDDVKYGRKEELEYVSSQVKTGVNGGEMPQISSYTQGENAAAEFEKLKLTYLNIKYNEEVLEAWKEEKIKGENAYTHIEKRLGYRYFVTKASGPKWLGPVGLRNFQHIRITIENHGFAPIEAGYEARWIVEYQDRGKVSIPADIRLEELKGGESMEADLLCRNLKSRDISRIGLQIYDGRKKAIIPEACVELSNQDFLYEKGVNYIYSR